MITANYRINSSKKEYRIGQFETFEAAQLAVVEKITEFESKTREGWKGTSDNDDFIAVYRSGKTIIAKDGYVLTV